ncbi:sigma-70 family RNA polymerase sigma factor [Kribbella lupini]|uniref:RNA polymerase sigma factor n=2 Tax=Kribbella lupini TaxID=291602 RepID=A0ABP4LFA8_9ACTN
MAGSVHDAEDLLQETLVRAWRAFDRYDESRASLRTWLYRIATTTCLTELEGRGRRPLPSGLVAEGDPSGPLIRADEVLWLQPFPADPAAVVGQRGSLRLALIAALQFLPARQRAALILKDVLDWSSAEIAAALELSPAAVNSALQRARAKLAEVGLAEDDVLEPDDPRCRETVAKFVAAFEKADAAAFAELLTADVVLEMPPFANWFSGRENHLRFVAGVFERRGSDWRVVPICANGQPGAAVYRGDGAGAYQLHTLHAFTVTTAGISHNRVFQDDQVFAAFGLARSL